jgi:hypothetical protein
MNPESGKRRVLGNFDKQGNSLSRQDSNAEGSAYCLQKREPEAGEGAGILEFVGKRMSDEIILKK